jgi:hypothetical protein
MPPNVLMKTVNINVPREAERLADLWKEGEARRFSWWWRMGHQHQRVPWLVSRIVLREDGVYIYIPDYFSRWNGEIEPDTEIIEAIRKSGAQSYDVRRDDFDDIYFYALKHSVFPAFVVMFERQKLEIWIQDKVLLQERLEIVLRFATVAEQYMPDSTQLEVASAT